MGNIANEYQDRLANFHDHQGRLLADTNLAMQRILSRHPNTSLTETHRGVWLDQRPSGQAPARPRWAAHSTPSRRSRARRARDETSTVSVSVSAGSSRSDGVINSENNIRETHSA